MNIKTYKEFTNIESTMATKRKNTEKLFDNSVEADMESSGIVNEDFEGNSSSSGMNSSSGNAIQNIDSVENVEESITPATFRMPEQAEKTLDLYILKLNEYYDEIGENKKDIISHKAKLLEAVLGTDRLRID